LLTNPLQNENLTPATTLNEQVETEPEINERYMFRWGDGNGNEFTKDVDLIYGKIVFWKKNIFMLPTGNAGKSYINELTRLLHSWTSKTALVDIALKAMMIMPSLLLQKPSRTSKAKDHLKALERRLDLWNPGNILELLHEAETIQKSLKTICSKRYISEISKKFASHMHKGNVNAAIKLLTDNMQNGILPLNDETLKLLKQKHLSPEEVILLPDTMEYVHPIKFEGIDEECIRKATIKTRGGSGPSGMDADGWRRIILSNCFGVNHLMNFVKL